MTRLAWPILILSSTLAELNHQPTQKFLYENPSQGVISRDLAASSIRSSGQNLTEMRFEARFHVYRRHHPKSEAQEIS